MKMGLVRLFQHQSLDRKLIVIVAVTGMTATLLFCAGVVAYQYVNFRATMVNELETTADVIGANGSAALRFEVVGDATRTLASLAARPYVSGACLFTTSGDLFAAYSRDGGMPLPPPMPLVEDYTFVEDSVIWVKHISHDGDFIGSVHIVGDLEPVYRQIRHSIFATLFIVGACSIVALLISTRLLRAVAQPINNLVQIAGQVTQSQDYSLRATKYAEDDLGELAEEFNDMLGRIQRRDEELEQRVQERTVELSEANVQLAGSLEEKEVLLKEIHHRVKNNLQIISSLLSLQTNHIEDEQARAMFINSGNRVRAMANIHERLYMSSDLALIDFVDYIRALVGNLFQTYRLNPDHITLNIDVENVVLGLDHAIPCGLMLNELISNALKYAFPDGQKGEILVHMGYTDDDRVLMVVKDNGVGLPADLDINTSQSLGMQLINTLVRQMMGELELLNSHGTEVRIHFPLERPVA